MMSPLDVAQYLLRRKLLRTEETIRAGFSIANASRRNHVFKVVRKSGDSYLIKQGVGAGRIRTLRREVELYRLLARDPDFRQYLPKLHAYDRQNHTLIFEMMVRFTDMNRFHESQKRAPAFTGSTLGTALADLHSIRLGLTRKADLSGSPPSILTLHLPGVRTLEFSNDSRIELIKIVQRFGFGEYFDKLRRACHSTTLVHGDLRWDNCLVPTSARLRSQAKLKIVDWEFGGLGDPAWDIGSVFANYLSFWLSFIPLTGESQPDQHIDFADVSLEQLQPGIRSFWHAYRERRKRRTGLTHEQAQRLLAHSIELAAARLVQTAFEESGESALTAKVICLAQLSLNIFERPDSARTELLGLRE